VETQATNLPTVLKTAQWFLRLALAIGFLSAVADRFGLWGPPGASGVAWGSWPLFVAYVAKLNWFAPSAVVPFLAWVSTVAEVGLALGLLVGWQLRWFALGSGLLLLAFAVTMTLALGIKAPLDYSVFAASAGAFVLALSVAGSERSSGLLGDVAKWIPLPKD
jgi:putative oxidoreductase